MKYFTYDHRANEFEYHNTAEEAKKYAEESLDFYVNNDNHDMIDVCWGEIKESVHANDEVIELKQIKE